MNEYLKEIEKTLQIEADAILNCISLLKENKQQNAFLGCLEHLDETLSKGGKIIVTGVGKSGKIGQKIAATLSSTGSLSVYLHPTEGLHGDLGVIRPGDSIIALSYSGNTEEILGLLPSLKHLKTKLIGIGGNDQSKLADACDIWINASVPKEACPHNLAPTSSSTLCLAIGDAIAVALMKKRGFNKEGFIQNHPAGSIGKKLQLKVSELMHRDVPCVSKNADMEEVIVKSTEKRLGAVFVTDKEFLLGIITDGDIRRALHHKEKFFQMKASDIMNAHPVSVTEDTLALDALRMMENRKSQISVLAVTHSNGKWKGLIRLHDLVQNI